MRYKSLIPNLSDINFLKEIFNLDEFVKTFSRDLQPRKNSFKSNENNIITNNYVIFDKSKIELILLIKKK